MVSGVESNLVSLGEIPWRFLVIGFSGVDSGSELRSFPGCIILREEHQKMFLLVLDPPPCFRALASILSNTSTPFLNF